jgi:hypothetical protein
MEPLIWEEYLSQVGEESGSDRPANNRRRLRRTVARKTSPKPSRSRKKKQRNVRP